MAATSSADPDDRRRNVVTITRRGGSTLERLDRVLDGVQSVLLSPLEPSDRTTLVRLLAKLA